MEILGQTVPELIRRSLIFSSLDAEALRQHVLSAEDQVGVRMFLLLLVVMEVVVALCRCWWCSQPCLLCVAPATAVGGGRR